MACSDNSFLGKSAVTPPTATATPATTAKSNVTNGYNTSTAAQAPSAASPASEGDKAETTTSSNGQSAIDTPSTPSTTSTNNNNSNGQGFVTSLGTPLPAAPQPMYAVTARALYAIDPASGNATLIGQFTLNGSSSGFNIYDIAIDGHGQMFAVDQSTLYAVNPLTAALTVVMNINLGFVNALTVLSDGSLVVGGDGIAIINGTTHSISNLVAAGKYQSSGDLIALPNKKLYWTVTPFLGVGNDQLLEIDPTSGTITTVGTTGAAQIYGLGYASGNMYAFTSGGGIAIISYTTGQVTSTLVGANGATPWNGATTNPVKW